MTTAGQTMGGLTTLTADEHRDLARCISLVLEVGILERTSSAGSERIAALLGESEELAPRLETIFTSHADRLRAGYETVAGGGDTAQTDGVTLSPEAQAGLVQFVQNTGSGDVVDAAVAIAVQAASTAPSEGVLRDDVGVPSEVHHVLQGLALAATLTLGPEAGAVFEVIDLIFSIFG